MTRINIQIQDITGNWLTVNTTSDMNPQNVTARLLEAANGRGGRRVRAIDASTGALLDVR